MESLLHDLRYAARQVIRNPGFAAVVVLTLGVGIGVNTAIFSVVNGVLLEPLPYEHAERLLMVSRQAQASGDQTPMAFAADGWEFVEYSSSVDSMVAFSETTVGPMVGADIPRHVKLARVSDNIFDVFGVAPHVGRTFVPEDGTPIPPGPDGQPIPNPPPFSAVISHGLWQRAFGGDIGVLNNVVDIWGTNHLIVGVLPPGFRLELPAEMNVGEDIDVFGVWRTDYPAASREPGADFWRLIGRLAPGARTADAQSEATAFSARLREAHPHHAELGFEMRLDPLHAKVTGPASGTLGVFIGAVGFVLLIACANVANLLLVRGTARRTEIAVRSAMGAGRRRIVRQLVTEAALQALAGAGLGVLLASTTVIAIKSLAPAALPRVEEIRLDGQALAFTLAVAMLATVVSALLPALAAARPGASGLNVRGAGGRARTSQRALVVAEVALSMMLLVGAGLMVRTFAELQQMQLGYEPEQVITVTATQGGSRTLESSLALEDSLVDAVAALPGIEAAGVVFPVPMNGVYDRSAEFARDGSQEDATAWSRAYFRTISPTYFDSVGLSLLRGRGIERHDADLDIDVVVIDERLAARYFAGRNPIGERIQVRGMRPQSDLYEVVGVVEYSPQWDHRDEQPTMYFHRIQYLSAEISVMAKVAGDPTAAAQSVLEAVRTTAPQLPADLAPLAWFVSEALTPTRFVLVLLTAFSALAVILAAVGLYAVLAYTVRQQTQEIGIRMALGAGTTTLVGSVVSQGVRMAVLGVLLGLGSWTVIGGFLESQLYGVTAYDPLALAATAAVLIAVAAAASYVPARRASRVDPVAALSSEG